MVGVWDPTNGGGGERPMADRRQETKEYENLKRNKQLESGSNPRQAANGPRYFVYTNQKEERTCK